MLHSTPSALKAHAPGAADKVRAALPDVRIWLGVAGDAGGDLSLPELHRRRVSVGDTARACGAEAVVLNCEARWKLRKSGFLAADARRWITDLRVSHPTLAIGHSAYDQPALHGRYPWREFLGPAGCAFSLPQVYWAEGGTGPHRLAAHRRSWASTAGSGRIDPACSVWPYLQAHGCSTADLCRVADEFESVAFWPPYDAAGALAAAALAEIDRLGLPATVGRIRAAQRHLGLTVDGIVGLKTLGALGVL